MGGVEHDRRGGFSAARLERLAAMVRGYVERGEIAGVAALIHRYQAITD